MTDNMDQRVEGREGDNWCFMSSNNGNIDLLQTTNSWSIAAEILAIVFIFNASQLL